MEFGDGVGELSLLSWFKRERVVNLVNGERVKQEVNS